MAKNKFETLLVAFGKATTLEAFKKIAEEAIAEGNLIIVTNGELSAKVNDGLKQLSDLQKVVTGLQSDLAQAQTALTSEKTAHVQTQNDAQGMIEGLKTQLANSEKQVEEGSSKVEVTHEKVTYMVVVPMFKLNGVQYEAKELKSKPSVVAELVEMGAGILVKK